MFSNLSLSSISLATETPSFVTVGAPKHHVTALRAERDFYRVGENLHALDHPGTGVLTETYIFSIHWNSNL